MPPFPAYHRPLSLPYSRQQDLPALLLRADPSSSVESSPSTTGDSISASDLILEAEEHWNVSAKSIPFLGHHSLSRRKEQSGTMDSPSTQIGERVFRMADTHFERNIHRVQVGHA